MTLNQEYGWIILQNGRPMLTDGRFPIYWTMRAAKEWAAKFKNTEVKKIIIPWK